MKKPEQKTIGELVFEYFKKHPRKDIPHGPVVDWVTKKWLKNPDKIEKLIAEDKQLWEDE